MPRQLWLQEPGTQPFPIISIPCGAAQSSTAPPSAADPFSPSLLQICCANAWLSYASQVNLPARRVIIRSMKAVISLAIAK